MKLFVLCSLLWLAGADEGSSWDWHHRGNELHLAKGNFLKLLQDVSNERTKRAPFQKGEETKQGKKY